MADYIKRKDTYRVVSPAADVREVVRGVWLRQYPHGFLSCSTCSVCGFAGEETPFCPNCGADMRPREEAVSLKASDDTIDLDAAVCIAEYAKDQNPVEAAIDDRGRCYNMGWEDACHYIREEFEELMETEEA